MRSGSSAFDRGHHNPLFIDQQVVKDLVIANRSAPPRRLQAFYVAAERILLQRV